MCLVAFQKNFRKIFSGVWKRRRKTQIQKNTSHNPEKNHQQWATKTQQNASNQAKETKTQQKKMNQRRAVRSPLVDRRAMQSHSAISSIAPLVDWRAMRSSERSHRAISSIAPLVGTVRSSDERRDRRSEIFDLGSLFSHSLSDLGSLFSLSLSLFPEMNWSENEGKKSFLG